MKKKFISALVLTLAFAFAGCENSDNNRIVTDSAAELIDMQEVIFDEIELEIPALWEYNTELSDDSVAYYDYTVNENVVSRVQLSLSTYDVEREYMYDGLEDALDVYISSLEPDSYSEYISDAFNGNPCIYTDFIYNDFTEGRAYSIEGWADDTYIIAFVGTSDDIYEISDECINTLILSDSIYGDEPPEWFIEEYDIEENPTPEEDAAEPETETPATEVYFEGTYKIGSDMPAGEYRLTSTSTYGAYYEILSNSTGIDNIIDNDNFDNQAYVTVSEGQYLKLVRCTAKPAQ